MESISANELVICPFLSLVGCRKKLLWVVTVNCAFTKPVETFMWLLLAKEFRTKIGCDLMVLLKP